MKKFRLENHRNSGFYNKSMYFDSIREAKAEQKRCGGQLYRTRDGSRWDDAIGWYKDDFATIYPDGQGLSE